MIESRHLVTLSRLTENDGGGGLLATAAREVDLSDAGSAAEALARGRGLGG